MAPTLAEAHRHLDRAVDAAYVYKGKKDDASRAAFLFDLYLRYTSFLPVETGERKHSRRKAVYDYPKPERNWNVRAAYF